MPPENDFTDGKHTNKLRGDEPPARWISFRTTERRGNNEPRPQQQLLSAVVASERLKFSRINLGSRGTACSAEGACRNVCREAALQRAVTSDSHLQKNKGVAQVCSVEEHTFSSHCEGHGVWLYQPFSLQMFNLNGVRQRKPRLLPQGRIRHQDRGRSSGQGQCVSTSHPCVCLPNASELFHPRVSGSRTAMAPKILWVQLWCQV